MLKGSEKKRGRRRKVKASQSYLESLSLLDFGDSFFILLVFVCACFFVCFSFNEKTQLGWMEDHIFGNI